MKEKREEIYELKHDPVPGYKRVFYIVLIISSAYLAYILLMGMK